MIVRTDAQLIASVGEEGLGSDLCMTSTARAAMPCGCEIIVGEQDGEQAGLALACDDEHEDAMEAAVQAFCFAGRHAEEIGDDREHVVIADEALKLTYTEAGFPVR